VVEVANTHGAGMLDLAASPHQGCGAGELTAVDHNVDGVGH
jgi:hypothetical protein